MKPYWIAVSVIIQAQILPADAQVFGLTDPRLCYILDGLLLVYAIIVTALFFREKLTKKGPAGITDDDTYTKVNHNTRDIYNTRADAESGGRRGKQQMQDNTVYQGLEREKMSDPYNQIGIKQQPRKKGKGNEKVYQGLNAGTRDTYDALQMMPLR